MLKLIGFILLIFLIVVIAENPDGKIADGVRTGASIVKEKASDLKDNNQDIMDNNEPLQQYNNTINSS